MSKVYLTTTLPYVNAAPHVGFALELTEADAYVRFRKLMGDEVFFNTGTDEHGLKIYRNAQAAGVEPQAYVDGFAEKFRGLKDLLDLSEDVHFIRTTDPHHKHAAQEFWKRCEAAGDIYKKAYSVKYCVGCELEKTDSELENGKCPIHPNLEVELIEEENYFFRFSKYQNALLALYAENPDFVVPASRFGEIQAFVARGLEDFSISRLKSKMPWGIPVAGDETQVMYVWFDALVNYVSTLGWPENTEQFEGFWGRKDAPNAQQIAGKDNLRQQSAMWQAMLMSAGLPTSKQILIHGFITSGGQKMSKSLGNVIDPVKLVEEYGTEALRYFLLRHVHPFEDSDVTEERIKEAYNGNLANGLGNVVSRVMTMAQEHLDAPVLVETNTIPEDFIAAMNQYKFNEAMEVIWRGIAKLDQTIAEEKPFSTIKTEPERAKALIAELVREVYTIGRMLNPVMPKTSVLIKTAVKENKKPENLFPRKE